MSTLVVATLKSNSSSPPAFQNTSGTEVGTLCRAWVNFNGTGTVAIRAQFNVSSITDNGTGDYTVNFATAMSDANYGISFGGQRGDGAGFINFGQSCIQGTSNNTPSFTSSQIRFNVANSNGSTAIDWPVFCVSIFR
jgi:hypothetical protein